MANHRALKNSGGKNSRRLRILLVTPEISFIPRNMGKIATILQVKGGGLADISSALVNELFSRDMDIHVAIPHYRRIFKLDTKQMSQRDLHFYYLNYSAAEKGDESRIHFAEDRCFYYQDQVYDQSSGSVIHFALAFQRETMNHIIRKVRPDIVHCNDWTTGLIPGFTRRLGMRSLLTVHNIYSEKASLAHIEDRGIDAPLFWENLFYERPPWNYEESRDHNSVDLLCSGIYSATRINTVSEGFLQEVVEGCHDVPPNIRHEIQQKYQHGYAHSILNAPDPSYNPATDAALHGYNYSSSDDVIAQKGHLKRQIQQEYGLKVDADAPLFFWPSRLDPTQKGCELLSHIFYHLLKNHNMQVFFVADGAYHEVFHRIIQQHGMFQQAVLCHFSDHLSRKLYGASDYIFMPSRYEPCGMAQMVAQLYGSLPVVMSTGGLRDTVEHLDLQGDRGNGFRFEHYNTDGLWWAVEQALQFHALPQRLAAVQRVMREAQAQYNIQTVADHYIALYDELASTRL